MSIRERSLGVKFRKLGSGSYRQTFDLEPGDFGMVVRTYQLGAISVPVLNEVSLEIPYHRFSMLIGASGSGKTTLLNLIGCHRGSAIRAIVPANALAIETSYSGRHGCPMFGTMRYRQGHNMVPDGTNASEFSRENEKKRQINPDALEGSHP
jgi:ABC-type ATPase with predicted acetyltransferase domain